MISSTVLISELEGHMMLHLALQLKLLDTEFMNFNLPDGAVDNPTIQICHLVIGKYTNLFFSFPPHISVGGAGSGIAYYKLYLTESNPELLEDANHVAEKLNACW